jgi:methyl-accepting chemotaxis protein
MCEAYQRPRRALVRNQSPVTRLPVVVEVDPSEWGRTPRLTPAPAALPPTAPRPNLLAWRYSLRTQSAALFVLLAIVISGLLTAIALAYEAADKALVEQDKLRTWQHNAIVIDSTARTLITEVMQWNNAMAAKDQQKAQPIQLQIATDRMTITSLAAEIAALNLPGDTLMIRSAYAQQAAAVTTFAANSVASTPRSDSELQTAVAAARKAWAGAADAVDPIITAKIEGEDAVELARTNYFHFLLITAGVVFMIALALLWLYQSRLILRPITSLARTASALADGQPATIKTTNRKDEVGRLTGALAAWQETLGGALFRLRGQVAESATTLSVAAQELAAATAEQNAAATATSSSMELLASSSASIADTIDRAAVKADQTRSSLELAQVDLRASGDRTLALAGKVNEVEGILKVINDIADQTNLLALNAAIEAARAGDAGRGFAVVADEVRRLAERTKTAAGDIAKLVQGAQTQSSETVLALEKGVKQMERGLGMMKEMSELSTQVQLSTQQQRSVTAQVMDAIEHIAEGSRSVATTAQDMASAAVSQGELAADLAGSGWKPDR